jgi:hypothetical protein
MVLNISNLTDAGRSSSLEKADLESTGQPERLKAFPSRKKGKFLPGTQKEHTRAHLHRGVYGSEFGDWLWRSDFDHSENHRPICQSCSNQVALEHPNGISTCIRDREKYFLDHIEWKCFECCVKLSSRSKLRNRAERRATLPLLPHPETRAFPEPTSARLDKSKNCLLVSGMQGRMRITWIHGHQLEMLVAR